ncbi:MAG: 4Fe-4S binding protein [Anaerolineales bacterium]
MNLGTMLKDIVASAFRNPSTGLYPYEPAVISDRARGKLHYTPGKCTGCNLCVKECPADAIEIITLDRKAKQFVVRYEPDQCIYCGQCTLNCRFDCLELVPGDWELASTAHNFEVYYGTPEDVARVLAGPPEPIADDA